MQFKHGFFNFILADQKRTVEGITQTHDVDFKTYRSV